MQSNPLRQRRTVSERIAAALRTLEQLAKKEGRGTELISLYVPPDRRIHEVLGQLREELGTASNIKSRTTRQNVEDAIERTSQRLRLFKEPPPTGLVIFCGAIPQNGAGSEKMARAGQVGNPLDGSNVLENKSRTNTTSVSVSTSMR